MAPSEPQKAKKAIEPLEEPDIEIGRKADKPVEKPVRPFPGWRTSAFRRFFFLDVEPLVAHGYRTRLEPQDMYPEPTLETERLEQRFHAALKEEVERSAKLGLPHPDLKRVVVKGNGLMLLWTGLLYIISQACTLAGPLLLQRIVKGLNCLAAQNSLRNSMGALAPNLMCDEKSKLYYYCIGLFLAPALQSICENHQTYLLYMMGTRMRNSLMAAIYRKCLRLSNSSLQAESTGKVVTLMSNDAQKLQDAMLAVHALWGSPCYIVAVLILLWFQVGWAMFVGLGVMLTLLPLSGSLAAKLAGLRREIMQWTDKRVGYMNEIIQGIQMIKFYAWEPPFADKVQSARSQEARILRVTAFWQGVFGMVLFSGPVAVAIFCFGSYTIAGNTLSNADAYTALALFALLRFPMSFLPMLITMIVNALIALKRIGGFLSKPEAGMPEEDHSAGKGVVRVSEAEFTWDESAEKSTLRNITFEARPGTLTMVVGGVGSGKSSMLGSLIGHISKRNGTVSVGGSVAYVAQTAWVMNDSLQENVLIGHELRPQEYQAALTVSQLGPDLEILPNGDLTEIGDRGITLSGGQKQRVSIARAVYANADIYLLDDPLSAVDSHVGRALFEQCIRGPLRGKTVILVTNALQYLPHADNVIIMENGEIKAQGSYAALVEQGLDIEELAHLHDKEDEDEEAEVDQATPAAKLEAKEARESSKRKSVEKGTRASMDARVATGKVTLTRANTMNGAGRNLTGVEEREAGNISLDVVTRYFKSGGGIVAFVTLFLLYGAEQAARVYTDRWVGIWFGGKYNLPLGGNLGIYFALGCTYALITFARSLRFLFICVNAAVSLHNQLLHHLLRLPKTFFDTNPAGRILNRFSRDVDIMDSTLSASLIQFVGCMTTYISILIVIAIATKWFAIALLPLTVVYLIIQRYYIPAARELQRIESVSRSPIYSKFAEAMLGVATIRAYRREQHFTSVSDKLMEANAHAFVTQKLAAAWLAMRLDMLGLSVLTGCGVLVIAGNVDPGMAGLALVYALDLTRFLKHGTNMASKSEADFNSVERIVQYLKPEAEAEPETQQPLLGQLEKSEWPGTGSISVQKVAMRYRPNMPLVLKGVSFEVAGGEKVGLVGRTGSGKSSMFLVLFRMVEAESGRIMIDGVDIATLGVRHLRSKMSIIPQDPFMFSGTVRNNLDPFEQYTDDRLWEVLESVGLKPVVAELEHGLGAKVVDNGANFSLGQRQLICMARAMLRNSRILMLDEATASVDMDTDNLLQMSIRTAFADCTTLIIAHRLNTIMDVDRVIVMGNGQVLENDNPDQLLQDHKGSFSSMVDQTGRSSARYLRGLASSARRGESFRSKSMMRSGLSFAGRTISTTTAGGAPGGSVLSATTAASSLSAAAPVWDSDSSPHAADSSPAAASISTPRVLAPDLEVSVAHGVHSSPQRNSSLPDLAEVDEDRLSKGPSGVVPPVHVTATFVESEGASSSGSHSTAEVPAVDAAAVVPVVPKE